MKHIHTFESFLNEAISEGLYTPEPNTENEVIYNSISKKPVVDKKMKIKWKSESGFEKVACFIVTDIVSNDLIVFKKYPGESFNDRDAKTYIFKKNDGIISLLMHWSGGKFVPKSLPEDVVKLVNDLGLKP